MGAAFREQQRDLAADAARAADHDDDLAAEFPFGRHPLQLGFFERPVFDAEGLRPRQRDVVPEVLELPRLLGAARLRHRSGLAVGVLERVRTRHHVDGVDEELRGDPRFALVLAEPEQPEAGDDHDRRIGVAQRRRVRLGVRLVVRLVVLAVVDEPLADLLLQRRESRLRLPGDVQRRDAGAKEVIGTAGAQLAELLRPLRIGESERIVAAVEVRDDAAVRGHGAAQVRQQRRDDRLAIRDRPTPPRRRTARGRPVRVLLDELPHLIDGRDAADVALPLGLAPGEQAVAAEDDAVAAGVVLDRLAQHQRQLESRALPRHPDDLAAVLLVELLEPGLAVGAGRERDRPVGMQVIDVRKGQERVQRRVDRGGDAVLAERAQRVEADHLVFERFAAIALDQRLELVL